MYEYSLIIINMEKKVKNSIIEFKLYTSLRKRK